MVSVVLIVFLIYISLIAYFYYWGPHLKFTKGKLSRSKSQLPSFPPDFLFGVSTSAYQVEANIPPSNWSLWEKEKDKNGKPMCPHDPIKCDEFNNFSSDLALAKSLGCKVFRLSFSWARLNPSHGVFDKQALEIYKSMLSEIISNKMIPIVTLWHFEHPAWVEESGSVQSPCFLTYFKEYVEFLIPEISSLCNIYHTINEPIGFASTAYLGGLHPPGRHRFSVFMDAVSNLYKCHVIAYDIIKKHNPSALVSYAKNIVLFVPLHKFSLIELALSAFLNVYNRAGFEVFSREYIKIWGFTRPVPGIKGKLDFISINHYYCAFASLNPKDWGKSPYPMVTMGERYFSMSDFGWSLIPDSLSASIRWLDKHYNERIFHKKLHFFVTENGCADEKDIQREVFLIETLKQLRLTMNNGPLVDGYLVWSLIDNYEWAEGREKKFGLYQVNYDTQERIQRHSAVTYQSIISNSEKPKSHIK